MCGRHADLHVGNGLEGGWTGRFIQTLINAGDCSFVDETSTRILSDQGVTSIASTSAGWRCTSVDLDGCLDLVVTAPCEAVRPASPLVYRNNGSGRFSPLAPEHSFSDDETFGYRAMLIEEHGEGTVREPLTSSRGNSVSGRTASGDDEESAHLVTPLNKTAADPCVAPSPGDGGWKVASSERCT